MNLIYTFSHVRRQIAWAAGCLCCCLQLNGQVIYVSTRGNDKWNGSEKKPVASLVRAQELARAYGRDTSVEIVLKMESIICRVRYSLPVRTVKIIRLR